MESKVDRSAEKLGGKQCFPGGQSVGEDPRDILVSSRSSTLHFERRRTEDPV